MGAENIPKRPEPEVGDRAMKAAKVALSVVPLGGTAAALFEALFRPPLSKRRDKWLDSLADGLRRLQDQVDGFNIDDLPANDTFVTVMTNATQVALRNHQQEKLDALRNAVLNSTLPNAPDDDTQLMFLSLVDRLTPTHVRMLRLFGDPKAHTEERNISYENEGSGSLSKLIEDVFPELKGRGDFYNQVVRDLHASGLSGTEQTGVMITAAGMLQGRTTAWGRDFIRFISDPPPLTD